jgi:hypothetical protein
LHFKNPQELEKPQDPDNSIEPLNPENSEQLLVLCVRATRTSRLSTTYPFHKLPRDGGERVQRKPSHKVSAGNLRPPLLQLAIFTLRHREKAQNDVDEKAEVDEEIQGKLALTDRLMEANEEREVSSGVDHKQQDPNVPPCFVFISRVYKPWFL